MRSWGEKGGTCIPLDRLFSMEFPLVGSFGRAHGSWNRVGVRGDGELTQGTALGFPEGDSEGSALVGLSASPWD